MPFWVAHVAGHLAGRALTTRVISKAGSVTLVPLEAERARACWEQLLDAWHQGLSRPLPFALRSAFAWLDKNGAEAFDAARASYEEHDPEFKRFGERDSSAYLARAFPSFDALWADGEFASWTESLLKPLDDAIARAAPKSAKGGPDDEAVQ